MKEERVILFTGVTGFVGQFLSIALLKAGHRLVFLARSTKKETADKRVSNALAVVDLDVYVKHQNYAVVEGDLEDLPNNIPFINEIFHVAGAISFSWEDRKSTEAANLVGTKNILELASKRKVSRVHYIGTAFTHDKDAKIVYEDDLCCDNNFNNPYAKSKCLAEVCVRNWGKKNPKSKVFIYRPSIVVGNSKTGFTTNFSSYYRFMAPLALWLKRANKNSNGENDGHFPIYVPGVKGATINIVTVDYVVYLVTELVKKDIPGTYHITNAKAPEFEWLLKEGLKALGIHGPSSQNDPKETPERFRRLEERIRDGIADYEPFVARDTIFSQENVKNVLGSKFKCHPKVAPKLVHTLMNFAVANDFKKKNVCVSNSQNWFWKKYETNKPVIAVDFGISGISRSVVEKYIPKFIYEPKGMWYGLGMKIFLLITQLVLRALVWIFLNPRMGKVGNLDPQETEKVYDREAPNYDIKHHITTRGMDLSWRRTAGQFVSNYVLSREKATILDVCTGTGLTIKEISHLLEMWNLKADITGIDYNRKMLNCAKHNVGSDVRLVRADATKMVEQTDPEFARFRYNQFDLVTQVLGIGGISTPIETMKEVLKVLKENGQFLLIDMHKPIRSMPGEWPFIFKWFNFPLFESVCYEETTIPLVLKRLWAWRDTTVLFYLIRLVVYEEGGKYYGFEVVSFNHESERWWFSLPIMPTGKIIVEKVRISKEEHNLRMKIMAACKCKT